MPGERFPEELRPRQLRLPETGPRDIVLLTGADLRHRHFALSLAATFPGHVKAWVRVGSSSLQTRHRSLLEKWSFIKKQIRRRVRPDQPWIAKLHTLIELRRRQKSQIRSEEHFFAGHLPGLPPESRLDEIDIENPNHPDFVGWLKARDPAFLVILGGPLLKEPVLSCARAFAINQHAGWSPEYRGSNTTDFALLNRDLAHLGSTTHIAVAGADAGPILRRARIIPRAEDTPSDILCRAILLGTELMLETLGQLIEAGSINTYPQPENIGKTYLARELDGAALTRLNSAEQRLWLRHNAPSP